MIIDKSPNRLAIYFFFEKDGIVDRYIPFFLEDLKKHVSKLFIVSNGTPTEEGKEVLKAYGELFIRENQGFDVWAYKEALNHFGWKALEQFDEIILLNSTIMGPVYSLKETFDKMNSRDVDFWGMTMYFKQDYDSSGCCRYGYIPDHIQSHFIACRRTLVQSEEFHEYWEMMPVINNYWEAVGKHEMVFTKYFEDLGFKSDLSVDMMDLRGFNNYPLMMSPTKLIQERRCPIFKRKMFFHNPKDFMSQTAGEQSRQLLNYLETETDYNIDLIWESILGRYHHADIVKDMNLNFVLSDKGFSKNLYDEALKSGKIALVFYLQYEYFFEKSFTYAQAIPEQTDVYIFTDTQDKKEKAKKIFSKLKCMRLEFKVMEEGGDAAVLLIGMKDDILRYEMVCFVQDMDSHASTVILGHENRCFGSLLAGEDFVRNVITTFHENPRLGFLAPPPPNHGPYYTNIGNEWRTYYPKVKALMEELEIAVPISEDKPPVCPLETAFWFRPGALSVLYRKQWRIEEFQGINDVLERVYPYAVQQMGYYPAVLMSDKTVQAELGNLNFYVREYNKILMNHGIENYHQYMCQELNRIVADGKKLPGIQETERCLRSELEAYKEDRKILENMSFVDTLKFWLNNQKRKNRRNK